MTSSAPAGSPVVLMTTWRRALPTFVADETDLYTLGAEYVQSVVDVGGAPLLLPHVRPQDVPSLVQRVDAVVVCGGGDVDPGTYGAAPENVKDNDPGADAVELAVIRQARARQLPMLAICRGMQLLGVEYGATLRQDVTSPGTPHPPIPDDPAAVLALRHPITVERGSRLAELVGEGPRDVNAIHHQALGHVPDALHVVATAADGIVEAIEPRDWPSCIGVQWHPEKMYGHDRALFAWLVDRARESTLLWSLTS